ncbi:pentapeptide repeat-containing protein [Natrinema sp. HArc-T2]|uniref:pentapeptide repeat-containing protein n=1 Tax=Natrinema sp. HArc-T2 TaxID=3242701 RepID=UPI00359ED597
MDEPPQGRCGYSWPDDGNEHAEPFPESCCYRPALPQSDHCAWHADREKNIEDLESTRISSEVRRQNSPVTERLDGADLSGIDLSQVTQLSGAGLRGANFSDTDLRGSDLSGTDLRRADFSGANLRGSDLSEADLQGTDFSRANLQDANLSEADLRWGNLEEVTLSRTNFKKADLRDAKLPLEDDFSLDADFTGADLRGVDLPDDLNYISFSRAFLFQHPIDWDERMGVQDSDDVVSELESSEYFGPPTDDIGRYVCMERWPNVEVEKALGFFSWSADFSGKSAHLADFSGAHIWNADFSNSFLDSIDLSNSTLWLSDFSDADLQDADLTGADLRGADLTGADLRGADLTGADLRRTELTGIIIDGNTKCERLFETEELTSKEWNAVARAYHSIKEVFSENGMTGKARNYHTLERRSRGFEAKSTHGWRNSTYWGSQLSRLFTGYGVRIQPLLYWMLVLFSASTIWYVIVGVEDSFLQNVTYSVITFTTSPPNIPSGRITQIIAILETYLGTLFTVLLGYILGNREQF